MLVALGQPEHAVAGAEAELRIVLPLHEHDDEVEDMGPDIARVLLQLGAGGLDAGALVRLRLVFLDGGGAAPGVAAYMAGDVPAPEEDVDQVAAQAYVDLLADELMGHRVEVVVDGDVGQSIQLHIFTALSGAHFV